MQALPATAASNLCFRVEKSDLVQMPFPDGTLSIPFYNKIKLTLVKKRKLSPEPEPEPAARPEKKTATQQSAKTLEFIEKARNVHGDKEYDYSQIEYKNARTKVVLVHLPCGRELKQVPFNHLKGHGCKPCACKLAAIPRSMSFEAFLGRAKLIHGSDYKYGDDFVNSSLPMTMKHKCGLEFSQRPYSHLSGRGCSRCATTKRALKRTKSNGTFVREVGIVHDGKYEYLSEYRGSGKPIKIRHRECGFEFEQLASVHLSGAGCTKCSGTFRRTHDDFIADATAVHGDEFEYPDEYHGQKATIRVTHRKCGKTWQTTADGHLRGHGCKSCKTRLTQERFLERARRVHEFEYEYPGEVVNSKDKVDIKHRTCGNIFKQTPASHLQGKGCPNCFYKSESLARSITERLLDDVFDKVRPPWLEGLELDGLGRKTKPKLAFEYQGDQHNKEVKFFHREEDSFQKQQERDARKRKLCAEHGVTLFEIPHAYSCANPKKMEEFIRGWLEEHGYLKKTQALLPDLFDVVRPQNPETALVLADHQAATIQEIEDKRYARVLKMKPKVSERRSCQTCVDLRACSFLARMGFVSKCSKCGQGMCESCCQQFDFKCTKCR